MKAEKINRFMRLSLALFLVLTILLCPLTMQKAEAAGQVKSRLAQGKKDFPGGSRINEMITVPSIVNQNGFPTCMDFTNGGCNALVTYATLKIFHNPYVPGSDSFKKIGTAKTGSSSAMKKLFKKAKKGDVIRWHKGSGHRHFAIYLSHNGKGVKVYEANFGPRNKVWYNHTWPYKSMKSWSRGATQVSLYRSKNYNEVNKGKAAWNLSKGTTFTYDGITYRVIKAGIRGAMVTVVSKTATAGTVPKAIGINYDTSDRLLSFGNSFMDYMALDRGASCRIKTYSKDVGRYEDEQYFIVK